MPFLQLQAFLFGMIITKIVFMKLFVCDIFGYEFDIK